MKSALTARLQLMFLDLTERIRAVAHPGRREGQGMVEYALILMLVAMIVIITVRVIGTKVNTAFSNVSNGLNQ